MKTIESKIKHFEKIGFNVVDFKTYKSMLNQIGYDINMSYANKWGCYNSWDGEQYIATSCFFKNTNIGFANIAGNHLRNTKDSDSLSNIRLNYCFYFGENIYIV